jgi:hypothetical protein
MAANIVLIEKPTEEKAKKKVRGKKGGARPNSGRKRFCPTKEERAKVKMMAGYGIQQEHIASVLREDGINVFTLRKYFSKELLQGRAEANTVVAQRLFKRAVDDGDTTACIWWTKSQMGWSDTQKIEHTSPDGSMSPAKEKPTPEELIKLAKERNLPTSIFEK